MKVVHILVALLPVLLLIGCGEGRPRPADTPRQLMDPPKIRPMPGGGNRPPATTQRPLRRRNGLPAYGCRSSVAPRLLAGVTNTSAPPS